MRTVTKSLFVSVVLSLLCLDANAEVEQIYVRPSGSNAIQESISRLFGKATFGKNYALIIGVSDYTNGRDFRPLSAAARDAERMHDFLKNEAGFDYIVTLTDEHATKGKIEEYMETTFPALIKENDRFFFYFSGHGITRDFDNSKRGYLALKDAATGQWHRLIEMDRIRQWAVNVGKARHVLFMLDACFSGLVAFEPKSSVQEKTIERLMQPANHIITAGTEGEQSFIVGGESLFTQAFLSAARGEVALPADGVVSLSEIMVQINRSLDQKRAELRDRIKMSPHIYPTRTADNGGEFFFVPPKRVGTASQNVAGLDSTRPLAKGSESNDSNQQRGGELPGHKEVPGVSSQAQPSPNIGNARPPPVEKSPPAPNTRPQVAATTPAKPVEPQKSPPSPGRESERSTARIDGLASTADKIRARGRVICGVGNTVGFSSPSNQGKWAGLDVDICRAIATAILGNADKVTYVPTSIQTRFTALQSDEVDVLARTTVWTLTRDTALGFDFPAISFYDGQGFMVNTRLGVRSARELDGATVCLQPGTTIELNVADYFRALRMKFKPLVIDDPSELAKAFFAGRCDVLTMDVSVLHAVRAQNAINPGDYMVLPELISKEPMGPLVRHRDFAFADIVRWSLYAMIEAEEYGITSKNVDSLLQSENPSIQRFLGVTPGFGKALGLDEKWAYNIIKQVGNYGESFDRNLGSGSPLKVARGLNALWINGGLQYSLPFR
jgi:general L-amino acid transport system substrate-binding protein